MSVVFVAGIYGVGKSTLCDKIKSIKGYDYYNSSDLISKNNKEIYGNNKYVKDVNKNQEILLSELKKLKKDIILTGHFCIANSKNEIDVLPLDVFAKMNITKIIVLKRDLKLVKEFLKRRDNKDYSLEFLNKLQNKEISLASIVASDINVDLSFIDMEFNENDIMRFIEEVGVLNG